VLSGIIGAALLGLGATARKGPRTGYPEIIDQDFFRVVSDFKKTGSSFVRIKDPLTGKVRTIPVRALEPKPGTDGSYTWKIDFIAKGESPTSSAYSVKGDDELFGKYRYDEAILLSDKLDFNRLISVLKHEIIHASDPSLVLQRRREIRKSVENYFYSREEVKARLAQIEHEIMSNPGFFNMKESCDAQIKRNIVDFDESSGELVYQDSIVYKNLWNEKCDPDDVPISKLISFSPTAQELLTPFKKRFSKGSGEVPVPKPTMKAIGALLARIQQKVRDTRHERTREQVYEQLKRRREAGDLGSPPAARFVRKRSYRT
jgi:uncharacterized protein YbgA (DUF1722 family)